MSYDLYLYLKREGSVSVSDVENYLSENIVPVSEHGQWEYENEDTGVHFMFEKYDGTDEAENLDPGLLEGFEAAGIDFTINFIRPDFFGLEVFPLVDKLLQEFDIYILNLQNEPVIPPYRPKPGELYEQWSRQNIQCRGLLPDDVDLYYYPRERSTALWRHNFAAGIYRRNSATNILFPTQCLSN